MDSIDDGILEQFVTLTGPVASLAQAVTRVNECVQVDFLQPWYVKWGSHWILCYADELMNRVDKTAVAAPTMPMQQHNMHMQKPGGGRFFYFF